MISSIMLSLTPGETNISHCNLSFISVYSQTPVALHPTSKNNPTTCNYTVNEISANLKLCSSVASLKHVFGTMDCDFLINIAQHLCSAQ